MDSNSIKLSTISLLNFFVIGLIAPVIAPRFLELGASHAFIGVLGSIYAGLLVLTGPVVGSWSDIQGRKFVVFVTSIISAVCYILLGLTTSLAVVLLLRSILGLVEHIPILTKAIIGDLIPIEKRTKAFSKQGIMTSFGLIIGPIIGGHLVEKEHGFFFVCVLSAVINIMIIAITQTFPEEKNKQSQSNETSGLMKNFLKIFLELTKVDWKTHGDLLFLRFILSLSIITYFTNQTLYLHEKYDLPQKSVGYIISLFGALGVISAISIPYIKKTFYKNDANSSKFMFHQCVTMAASFFILYVVSNLKIFLLALVPLALANTSLSLVTMEVILNRSTDDSRGSLTGVSESMLGIGRCIAPLASGIVASYFGESNVLFFAFITSLSGIAVCLKLLYQDKPVNKTD